MKIASNPKSMIRHTDFDKLIELKFYGLKTK